MLYLLNSAVITAPGLYRYRYVTVEEARKIYARADKVESTIGYQETAEALSEILGQHVPVNKVAIQMLPGDQALVYRIVLPPGHPRIDPKDKGQIRRVIDQRYWELGLLERVE